jgi:4a-hydroxytetrahydrobiopterin dehydratase
MTDLSAKKCVPCMGGVPPLDASEVNRLVGQLEGWQSVDNHHITKAYEFPDFMRGVSFVNEVARVAEEEGHHPDVHLTWGKVAVDIWTHKIDGLTESDFILAAKIDKLLS